MDFGTVHCYGRAVADARLYNIDSDDNVSRAVFDIAMNISIRRDGKYDTKAIFRRVVAWGYHADYIAKCQNSDPEGLKGRPVVIIGSMDTESFTNSDTGEDVNRDVIRIGPPNGIINIIDRRTRNDV